MQDKSDQEILSLCKMDVQKGFSVLLRQYREPVYYHLRNMLYNHADADDVTQNTFVKVYKNLEKFKGESKLFSWIYRIATNEAINFLNKKAREKNISYDEIAYQNAQNLTTDAFFDGDEMMRKLLEAVAQLPEKQRIVFQMKYFEELKYNQISEILEVSVGSLKASYHHAVKKLKKFLVED